MCPRPVLLLLCATLALVAGPGRVVAQDPPDNPAETADEPAKKDDAEKPATAKDTSEEPERARPVAIGEAVPPDVTLLPVPEPPPAVPEGDEAPPEKAEGTEPEGPVAVSVVSLTRGDGEPPPAPPKPAKDAGTGESTTAKLEEPPKKDDTEDAPPARDPPRPVVLLYWSRSCPVAKRYVSPYSDLAKDFGKSVRFHFVVANHGESPDEARQALADAGVSLRVFSDPERATAGRFGVRVTPTALVLDAKGVLRYRGPVDDDRMAKAREPLQHLRLALTALLADKPIEGAEPRPFGSALRAAPVRR